MIFEDLASDLLSPKKKEPIPKFLTMLKFVRPYRFF